VLASTVMVVSCMRVCICGRVLKEREERESRTSRCLDTCVREAIFLCGGISMLEGTLWK